VIPTTRRGVPSVRDKQDRPKDPTRRTTQALARVGPRPQPLSQVHTRHRSAPTRAATGLPRATTEPVHRRPRISALSRGLPQGRSYLLIVLAARVSALWLLSLSAAGLLYWNGLVSRREGGTLLADSLLIGRVEAPALEKLKATRIRSGR
jgi:hypothetical protein